MIPYQIDAWLHISHFVGCEVTFLMQHALSFYQCTSHFAFARAVARAVADRQVNALGHLREGGKILKNKETVRVCVCRVTESLLFRTKKHVQLMQSRKRMSADAPCKLSRLLFNSCLPLLSVKPNPVYLSLASHLRLFNNLNVIIIITHAFVCELRGASVHADSDLAVIGA